jgi:transcription elongation factor Elf1
MSPRSATKREAAMERLHFRCQNTGQNIDVGIESELDTLLRIRDKRILARCPLCGERHEWQVAEAQLEQAA